MSKKFPVAIVLFKIGLTINILSIKISGLLILAYRLRLEALIKARQKGRVKKIILEAITIAEKLKFLKSWNWDEKKDIYEFKLNPQRCSRIKNNLIQKKKEIDIEQLKKFSSEEETEF